MCNRVGYYISGGHVGLRLSKNYSGGVLRRVPNYSHLYPAQLKIEP